MKPAIQSMERYGALFCQLMDECQQQREEGTELHFPLLCVWNRVFVFVQDAGHRTLTRSRQRSWAVGACQRRIRPSQLAQQPLRETSRKGKTSLSEIKEGIPKLLPL